jgi:hypothetical protein
MRDQNVRMAALASSCLFVSSQARQYQQDQNIHQNHHSRAEDARRDKDACEVEHDASCVEDQPEDYRAQQSGCVKHCKLA